MNNTDKSKIPAQTAPDKPEPPGKVKIAEALKTLLTEKDFNSITTAEISRVAGVNEALIYRYFGDKRGLLHQVLSEYTLMFIDHVKEDIKDVVDPVVKLEKLIQCHFYYYQKNHIFAKILLLEVRNFPGYFESETYQIVRKYADMLLTIIEEGVAMDKFRNDIPAKDLRQIIIGGIEHLSLPCVIFKKEISHEELSEKLCGTLFKGILTNPR